MCKTTQTACQAAQVVYSAMMLDVWFIERQRARRISLRQVLRKLGDRFDLVAKLRRPRGFSRRSYAPGRSGSLAREELTRPPSADREDTRKSFSPSS
jgi:hypothetical protein